MSKQLESEPTTKSRISDGALVAIGPLFLLVPLLFSGIGFSLKLALLCVWPLYTIFAFVKYVHPKTAPKHRSKWLLAFGVNFLLIVLFFFSGMLSI